MAFLCKSKTCFFVEFPKGLNVPEPLRCYPGFKAALEDICDRFGSFYAPFAAYNCVTRMITLYARETPRPENKFIDEDTAIFDLEKARSAVSSDNLPFYSIRNSHFCPFPLLFHFHFPSRRELKIPWGQDAFGTGSCVPRNIGEDTHDGHH